MSDFLNTYELYHYGIQGQKWGVRNGPPYPLKGVSVRRKHYSLQDKGEKYYKIHKGDEIQTLSYDKDRIKDKDMYFATMTKKDKDFYTAFFNKKVPNDEVDENGKRIGPAYYLKWNIKQSAKSDINVANEREGIEAFTKLMRSSKDFSNFILDKNRMLSNMDEKRAAYEGYVESLKVMDKMQKHPEKLTSEDMKYAYRIFNYIIVKDGDDIARQRARFFKELKNEGYGAVLDTNDAMYGRYKRESPIIVFDKDALQTVSIDRVKGYEKLISLLRATTINKLGGIA